MPLYEYDCLDCEESFEVLRPMAQADQSIACEICGGERTARSLSLIASPQIGKDSPDLPATASSSGACACGGMCACGGH